MQSGTLYDIMSTKMRSLFQCQWCIFDGDTFTKGEHLNQ